MNFLELQTRTKERLDEPSTSVYYSAAEIKEALNKAQRLFALLTLCIERTGTITMTGGQTFYTVSTFLSDFLAPLRVTFRALSYRLRPSTIHDLDAYSSSWRSVTAAAPDKYAFLGYDLFAITPQWNGAPFSSRFLDVVYAATPAVMSLDADTPEIPADIHPCLIDYALYYLRLKEGGQELQKTLPSLGAFLDAAQKYAAFFRARSLSQQYDRQPVDIELFDRSRLMKMTLQQVRIQKAGMNTPFTGNGGKS